MVHQGFMSSSPRATQTDSSAEKVSSWGKHIAKSRINTEQSSPTTEKNKKKNPFIALWCNANLFPSPNPIQLTQHTA